MKGEPVILPNMFLSREALVKLRNDPGKYKMEDNSTLSAKLQVWWTFVAGFMPTWLSANFITVAAVFPTVFFFALAVGYGFPPPRWVDLGAAVSVFFFQTMDAVDGKQARALGTSSPIGDFLDHQVDGICLMVIASTIVLCSGTSSFICFIGVCCVGLHTNFVHWEASKLLVMLMDNGTSITEGQIVMMILFALPGIFGATVYNIHILPQSLGRLLPYVPTIGDAVILTICGVMSAQQIFNCIMRIARAFTAKKQPLLPIFSEVFSLVLTPLVVFEWWFYGTDVRYTLVWASIVFSYFQGCVTLHRLTLQPLLWHNLLPMLIPGAIVPPLLGWMPLLAPLFVLFCLAWFFFFLYQVCTAFAAVLGLPIFANPSHVAKMH
ncbi:sn-1,2-diacylglycerol cholinephosphotransferase [Pelomyxa schiedti]|nr:sn-1,2-diacylglycerol cholinephosphotransferase [Pelomyxa schiedti]